jgi:hypothetical protein
MSPVRPKDEDGLPIDPVLAFTSGGGGSGGYHFGVWVYPLPPAGPLEIFVSMPTIAGHEERVVIDGSTVRAAAEQATVIWD